MPRPQAPCGSYSAYRRHLLKREPIDDACRRAQREHDAGRGARSWRKDVEPAPAPVVTIPAEPGAAAREMFAKCAADLIDFVADDYLFGVIDLMGEMNELLEQWRSADPGNAAAAR